MLRVSYEPVPRLQFTHEFHGRLRTRLLFRWHMHDRTAYVTGAKLLGLLALMGLLLDAQSLHCQQLTASASDPAAQVQLPVVNLGETNFEDGFGTPGWLLEEFPESSVADTLRDGTGRTVPGSNRVTVDSTTSHIAFVSHKRLLGAWLAGEALVPLVDVDVQLKGADTRVRGVGDLTVGSGLQWQPRKIGKAIFVQRLVIDVGVPTGKYSDARPLNIGNHFVLVNPYYAFTYEPNGKVEVSVRVHYLWNSINHDPFVGFGIKDMQAGQAFHANYAVSYQVLQNVRLGFNGYWLQQLTDDKINGASFANSKERTVGLGPGIQLGGRGLWFRVNGYMETGVRNRPSAIKVTFRVSKALAAEH